MHETLHILLIHNIFYFFFTGKYKSLQLQKKKRSTLNAPSWKTYFLSLQSCCKGGMTSDRFVKKNVQRERPGNVAELEQEE